jgi:hypothetical protein
MAIMLPSPSALQPKKKKKKATSTRVSLPSLLCYNKQKEEGDSSNTIDTFFFCCNAQSDGSIIVVAFCFRFATTKKATTKLKKESTDNFVAIAFFAALKTNKKKVRVTPSLLRYNKKRR